MMPSVKPSDYVAYGPLSGKASRTLAAMPFITIESALMSDATAVTQLLGEVPAAPPAGAWALAQSYATESRLAKLYYISSEIAIVVSVSDVSETQLERIVSQREPALLRARGVISKALLISIVEQALGEGLAPRARMH
jgi:hypothetical protein